MGSFAFRLRLLMGQGTASQILGAIGYRVEDYREVGDAVAPAVKSGRPGVIEAVMEGGKRVLAEPFRRDALKTPVRTLKKYKHLT